MLPGTRGFLWDIKYDKIILEIGTIQHCLCRIKIEDTILWKVGEENAVKNNKAGRFGHAVSEPGVSSVLLFYPQKHMVFTSRKACEFIESDLFLLLIIDATAYMVWRYMGFDEYMEIYSGYDPAWKFAHQPDYWIKELTDVGIIPTVKKLYENCNDNLGFVTEAEIDIYLRFIVPRVMKKYDMDAVIQTAEEFRCFEDYDFWDSRQKIDFFRQWYHIRTKHPTVSLEEFQENYAESHYGQEWEEPDKAQNVEENVVSQVLVEEGVTLEEIAEKLGYKTHSAVHKRIRKIGWAYEKFTGEDFGFSGKKII